MILIIKLLLLLTVFLIPLIGANFGFGFEQIKVLLFLLMVTLNGFLWAWTKPKIKSDSILLVAVGYITTLGITSVLGINPWVSFLGTGPYYHRTYALEG